MQTSPLSSDVGQGTAPVGASAGKGARSPSSVSPAKTRRQSRSPLKRRRPERTASPTRVIDLQLLAPSPPPRPPATEDAPGSGAAVSGRRPRLLVGLLIVTIACLSSKVSAPPPLGRPAALQERSHTPGEPSVRPAMKTQTPNNTVTQRSNPDQQPRKRAWAVMRSALPRNPLKLRQPPNRQRLAAGIGGLCLVLALPMVAPAGAVASSWVQTALLPAWSARLRMIAAAARLRPRPLPLTPNEELILAILSLIA